MHALCMSVLYVTSDMNMYTDSWYIFHSSVYRTYIKGISAIQRNGSVGPIMQLNGFPLPDFNQPHSTEHDKVKLDIVDFFLHVVPPVKTLLRTKLAEMRSMHIQFDKGLFTKLEKQEDCLKSKRFAEDEIQDQISLNFCILVSVS